MEATFPSFKHEFHLPSYGVYDPDRFRGPDRGRHIGNEEIPRQERQMGRGRGVATTLRGTGDKSGCRGLKKEGGVQERGERAHAPCGRGPQNRAAPDATVSGSLSPQ